MTRVLYFVHDPMCSWCWAFRPVWDAVVRGLPEDVEVRRLLGGLAPDSDEPMPREMRQKLQGIWRVIRQKVPGTEFNFDFWEKCRPRRSTFPACRAVIAARWQGVEYKESMIFAIQRAYYLEARNPSDSDTLVSLAGKLGMDADRFSRDLAFTAARDELADEIYRCRSMGVMSFPSLVLESGGTRRLLQHNYLDAELILSQIAG
ncbi:DsbA family protein [Solemya velesiana gill symbiont]|uniref:DsbA family protein n=1 Tax=Solemya velesiana gill symbiont TaxID=1918948 RepID=A0A1T2KYL1_9GAMM|nr:DsbA family protein [Solemya velesiana gill symbiont]OOZ37874.1 DsbA family protein [Solemya velesiana gill symbiont]